MANAKLLHILAIYPLPGPPQEIIFFPMFYKISLHFSNNFYSEAPLFFLNLFIYFLKSY
jgi:hypothetical protein